MTAQAEAHILHVDMDAFFVQLEVNRRPELQGLPVVVGGSKQRGVVAAASYEARAFGVFSAMPSAKAKRLCPDLVFLPGDLPMYAATSERIMRVLHAFTPDVEQTSIDEAFMDVSGCELLFGPPYDIARQVRAQVQEREGVVCSVGVGSSKLMAKLASREAKPIASPQGTKPGKGVCMVAPGDELAFLHPMPVKALWGVGPATQKTLHGLGITTVGELAAVPEAELVQALGQAHGAHVAQLAQGLDPSPVATTRVEKSLSHEVTFPHDLTGEAELRRAVWQLAEKVGIRLRASGHFARTVTLKIRYGDFSTFTRQHTMPQATQGTQTIAQESLALLLPEDAVKGVRLLGVGVSGFDEAEAAAQQLTLDNTVPDPSPELDHALDAIRSRYGANAIRRAVAGVSDFAPAPGFVPRAAAASDAARNELAGSERAAGEVAEDEPS